jgi:hypothetical protein
MMHRWIAASLVACFFAEGIAHAEDRAVATEPEPRERFGDAGHVVLEDLFGLSVLSTGAPIGAVGLTAGWIAIGTSKYGSPGAPSSTATMVSVAPSFDVFVTDHITIGGVVSFASAKVEQAGTQQVTYAAGGEPRVGWAAPLGKGVFVWPRVFGGGSLVDGAASSPTASWRAGADVLFVFPLARFAALDLGPGVSYASASFDGASSHALSAGMRGGLSLVF